MPNATIKVAKKWRPRPDPGGSEQHHPEEACLEEEGGQHLIGHQRPDHRPGLVGERAPIGAELVVITIPETTPMAKVTAKIVSQ